MKKISFFDGFDSSTQPDGGTIKANQFVEFANSTAYEAEYGAAVVGSVFLNTTVNKVQFYDGASWVDFQPEVLDEDDMASDSATALCTQQSIKAYVDQSFVKPVRYTTNAGQSLAHNGNPIIDFEDVDFDGDSIVTTGASWKCTPGETGYYAVVATVNINFGTSETYRARLRLFKNNSEYSTGEWKSGTTPASYSDVGLHIFDIVDITSVSDNIDIRCTQVNGSAAAKSISSTGNRNHIKIFKIREL